MAGFQLSMYGRFWLSTEEQIYGADQIDHHTSIVPARLPSVAIARSARVCVARSHRQRARETSRQVRRDHTKYEIGQSHESEGVQQEQRSKGLGTWSFPERGPDVSRADDPPHHETEEHTDPEYRPRLHH